MPTQRNELLPRAAASMDVRQRPATCTWPPATTPTRSTPTATRRSTSGPAGQRCDAQRTAGNTNDLRGKVLRITPAGRRHLHHPGGQPVRRRAPRKTRPEIYAMGFRNPFRIGIDPKTNTLYVADYGPDAGSREPDPRPGGHRRVEHRQPARQLRLAVLRRRQHAVHRLQLRRPARPARRSTAPRRSTTRPTTPA